MSDTGRKDFTQKAQEKITPDSTKPTQDKVKEGVTDTTDRVRRGVQPDDQKGIAQQAADKTQRSYDDTVHHGSGSTIGDKVKGALGVGKSEKWIVDARGTSTHWASSWRISGYLKFM